MEGTLTIDKLIIMDDISGLADKSTNFLIFLTVSRKYGFSCVVNWDMSMSQTHIFNFFSWFNSQ